MYLVSKEYFYMANPACDVTKSIVNEIENQSKMADSSLFSVKIFHELKALLHMRFLRATCIAKKQTLSCKRILWRVTTPHATDF